jgi:GT2 family glycosyltransferase
VPTLNRSSDLADLLATLCNQVQPAYEIIVIDDSKGNATADLLKRVMPEFQSRGTQLLYLRGDGTGNTSARNIGIRASSGDAVLFLDDDTLLEKNVIKELSGFLLRNPEAIGVQPQVKGFAEYWANPNFGMRVENLVDKVAMITYHAPNKLEVRRSGAAVYPSTLTMSIPIQRMLGCCFCLRRSILGSLMFDSNLKKWGCYDDLDLTYRIYRKHPGLLFAVPNISVVHRHSREARLQPRALNKMTTIYWFYIFFKDLSDESFLNSLAFIWAMFGFIFWTLMAAFVNADGKRLNVTRFLICDYAESLWHLRSIREGNLEFFNRTLQ